MGATGRLSGASCIAKLVAVAMVVAACGAAREPQQLASPPPEATASATAPAVTGAELERRPFSPRVRGAVAHTGISYGPFREGQRPGGPQPSPEQILEDLRLVAERWQLIRIYSSRGPAETILRVIRDHDLPLGVMLGIWLAPDVPQENAAEIGEATRLAGAYPEQVIAVSVGNETQVFWTGHRVPRETLLTAIRQVRSGITQPVTTADDYNFWNKPESRAVADEIDFLVMHAYAMWNRQPLDEAVPWTQRTVAAIAAEHPDLPLVLGETGWATTLNPEGDEVQHIVAPAGEAEQARFFRAFTAWATEEQLTSFYFEAFDEPWKGGDDPRDVEKHWGLFDVDRAPKAALRGQTP